MVSTSGSQGTKEFTAQRSHEVTSLRIAIYGAVSWEGKTDFFQGHLLWAFVLMHLVVSNFLFKNSAMIPLR